MISDAELASLRAESERFLPDLCQIQRKTLTPDAYGGQAEAWADLAEVACRVSPNRSQFQQSELVAGDRVVQQATYVVTMPAETDVTAADRIAWSDRVLQVLSVTPRSWEIIRRVYAVEQI